MRILLVDDNVDLTQTLTLLIEMYGHEAIACNDPMQAVSVAVDYHPDVAILDIGMPGLNGYELCHHLRQVASLSNIKIVAQSGYGDAESRKKSAEAGFDQHLLKPVPSEILAGLLAEWQSAQGL